MGHEQRWSSAGDFDSWDMEKVLEDKLQGWRAEPNHPQLPIPNSPIPSTPDEPRLFLVDRPGATQVASNTALTLNCVGLGRNEFAVWSFQGRWPR